MASHAARSRQARRKWAAKIANPDALTREVCDRVVKEGGPTFRTTARGHICNQTGTFLKRGQCFAFSVRVVNGTTTNAPYREAAVKRVSRSKTTQERAAPPPPTMRVLEWDQAKDGHYPDCPCCGRSVSIFEEGEKTCSYCRRTFQVVEKKQPVAKQIDFEGSGYHTCPHCSRRTWIDSIGLRNCKECGGPINVHW